MFVWCDREKKEREKESERKKGTVSCVHLSVLFSWIKLLFSFYKAPPFRAKMVCPIFLCAVVGKILLNLHPSIITKLQNFFILSIIRLPIIKPTWMQKSNCVEDVLVWYWCWHSIVPPDQFFLQFQVSKEKKTTNGIDVINE